MKIIMSHTLELTISSLKIKNLGYFLIIPESMKTLGLMMPIFNIGKKHMNHNMDHSNHN